MMKLSEKILKLRRQKGLSQEELSEKLNVSRQAISRWEGSSALPDASNILQLSKLFAVSADYLLNDEVESEHDIPAIKNIEIMNRNKIKKIIALCISIFCLCGNFVIYILSRFNEVMIPHITYRNGEKWYTWSSGLTGYSYKYFIQTYNLEFLTVLFWTGFILGMIYIFVDDRKVKNLITKYLNKIGNKNVDI